ncbi:MAG TPA: T9SS type A sorting domain-containing protein [Bacteroidota bacterium]|nr:T9SS type A sorting domain-containing protein [Bacteroidota bacterium]
MRMIRFYLHRHVLPALMAFLFIAIAKGQISSPIPVDVTGLSTSPILRWRVPVAGARTFHLQLSYDSSFAALASDDSTLTDTVKMVDPLAPDTGYYWRVSVKTDSVTSNWSHVNRFYAVSGESVYTYMQSDGWSLISLPIHMSPKAKAFVLPALWNPTPCWSCYVFYYSAGYVGGRTMVNGRGYWLKTTSGGFISLTGTTVLAETIDVTTNWNLIGSISSPVPTSSITSIPPGIMSGATFFGGGTFFGFSGGYYVAPTDIPFRGYWVRCNSPGKIILSSKGSKRPKPLTTMVDFNSFDVLRIEDAGGHRQTLYFGTRRDENVPNDLLEFPPASPDGVFDARFASDRMVEIVEKGKTHEFPIYITSAEYPVTLGWETKSQPINASLEVGNRDFQLTADGSTQLLSSDLVVKLKLMDGPQIPVEFALEQSYPNPFNPTTTIRYQLPVDSKVTLKIYNLLGQAVQVLEDGLMAAGFEATEWRASALPSGAYYYKLDAVGVNDPGKRFTQVRKALLLR